MRLPLAGIPLGSRSSSEAVGCRGLYRISAPQVRQNPEPSDSPSLHFQHVISVSSRRSTMPAPVAVALVPYSAAAPPVCGWLAYRRVSAARPPLPVPYSPNGQEWPPAQPTRPLRLAHGGLAPGV